MREDSSSNSPISSQAYYSEQVNVLEKTPGWIKIETIADHYVGWIKDNDKLHKRESTFPALPSAKVNSCFVHVYSTNDTIYGPLLTLPFDSKIEIIEDIDSRWLKARLVDGREAYIQRGDLNFDNTPLTKLNVASLSLNFLNLPYTWGGRSGFGYDCSGFVQMLYRQMGINLPRDSKDQINWKGFKKISQKELAVGDLIFFGLEKEKIRHVGFYIGNDQFIHATTSENNPKIHISLLKDKEWSGFGRLSYRGFRSLK